MQKKLSIQGLLMVLFFAFSTTLLAKTGVPSLPTSSDNQVISQPITSDIIPSSKSIDSSGGMGGGGLGVATWPVLSFVFPVAIILFGALVVFVQYKYLVQTKPNPDVSLPTFSLTLIITGTLALVSINTDIRVIGAVVGLFGTIAGYVLGRVASRHQPPET